MDEQQELQQVAEQTTTEFVRAALRLGENYARLAGQAAMGGNFSYARHHLAVAWDARVAVARAIQRAQERGLCVAELCAELDRLDQEIHELQRHV